MAPAPRPRSSRLRGSLYARSALFIALGTGSILGAVATLSSVVVERSVDRLLGERADLARTTGLLLEQMLRADLDRLAAEAAPAFGDAGALAAALSRARPGGLLEGGVVALDDRGELRAAVPPHLEEWTDRALLRSLAARARGREGPAMSPRVGGRGGAPPGLVTLVPVRDGRGELAGFVGGLLRPAQTSILSALMAARRDTRTEIVLVDQKGVVVASTDRDESFRRGDHDSALTQALRERREVRGRCHSCHVEGAERTSRATDVMAFAPLPTLDLGLAVHQPEEDALEPAFSLRWNLLLLGASFASLFVIFAGLSVRSVVRPITRLTAAVRELEEGAALPGLDRFGADEVGELARALRLWHGRLVESLEQEQVLQRVLRAQEDERRRVARELHDTVSQELAALRLEVERLSRRPTQDLSGPLGQLEERARHMLDTVRAILLDLRLSELEHMGFLPALRAHLERVGREHRLRCVLGVEGEEVEPGYETAVTLFRILQEAMQNVVQHAGAEHVLATVSFRGTSIELAIQDDGGGFDVAAWRARRPGPDGLGLHGIEERARLLGGRAEITSSAGEGTTVRVTLPFVARAEGR